MVGSDYGRDYEAAKQDLAKLIESQEDTARKIIQARKKLELLAALCESEDIEIEPSREAEALLSNTSIADEIRMILRAKYPKWLRPHDLKGDLEDLGHDLKKYSNPQATIHMVLKRLVGKEVEERVLNGKQIYRCPPIWQPGFIPSIGPVVSLDASSSLPKKKKRVSAAP